MISDGMTSMRSNLVYHKGGAWGAVSILRCRLTSIGTPPPPPPPPPMLKTHVRLICNLGIHVLGNDGLYIETGGGPGLMVCRVCGGLTSVKMASLPNQNYIKTPRENETTHDRIERQQNKVYNKTADISYEIHCMYISQQRCCGFQFS